MVIFLQNKLWWRMLAGLAVVAMAAVVVEGKPWEEGAVVDGSEGTAPGADTTLVDGSQPEQPLYLFRAERAAKEKGNF